MTTKIVDYEPRHADAFRALNEAWISANFTLEEHDRRLLGDPEGSILRKGGRVLVALDEGEPVGVCALVRHGTDVFELSKFAVAPSHQGRGVGRMLGEAAIAQARAIGAKSLILEGNTKMAASIHLYRKLGFREVTGLKSEYCRCNITMELPLA